MNRSTGKALKVRKAAVSVALVALLAPLAFTGSAAASAEDQYVEVVPSPGTERPTRGLDGAAVDPVRFDLTGPDAAAIARIAALFAAERDRGDGADSSSECGEEPEVAASVFGGGAGEGMGLLLPVALLITLGIGLGAFLLRRAGGSEG
jgi:hypothetical protein